ncbi:membrane protein [Gordonia phage LittleFella]|nr:membrane protein [Gordonia phage LittleFella]
MVRADLPPKTKVDAVVNFVRGITLILGVYPMAYGALTFIFGDALWGSGLAPTYLAALEVPWAPESWGTFAATCGIMLIVAELREKHVWLSGACFLQGVWCFTFGVFFIRDCIDNMTSFGAPGALIHLSLGVVYFLRCGLAWIWR